MRPSLRGWVVGVVCIALPTWAGSAQPSTPPPPSAPPAAPGDGVARDPYGDPLINNDQVAMPARRTLADIARRARVVARSHDAVVTLADVEDALRTSTDPDVAAFRTPEGRRALIMRLLRRTATAREAERRGLATGLLAYAGERASRRAAVDLMMLLDFDARGFEPTDVPVQPAAVERRRGVALVASTRAPVATWLESVRGEYYQTALERAQAVAGATAIDTDWVDTTPADGLAPELRAALFAIERQTTPSDVITLPDGRFAAITLIGVDPGMPPVDEAEYRSRTSFVRRDEAIAALRSRLRAEHLRFRDPAGLDGVAFRLVETQALQRLEGRYVEPDVVSYPAVPPSDPTAGPLEAPTAPGQAAPGQAAPSAPAATPAAPAAAPSAVAPTAAPPSAATPGGR